MATTNKNFKVKNGLEVAGEIGVGSTPSYGTAGQLLTSQGTGNAAAWVDQTSIATSTVKHQVKLGEAISKGQAVYVSSASGTNMIVSKASNATEATSSKTMGLLETGGSTNDFVNVITEGILAGLNTNSADNEGDPVWLGTSGNLIYGLTNKPIAPTHLVFIGVVTRKHATQGEIFVRPQNGFELNEIHNVLIGTSYSFTPDDNEVLAYDSTSSLWINQTASEAGLAALSGATFTGNVAGTNVSATGVVSGLELTSTQSSGSEGGQINLAKPATTSLSGNVIVDVYNNQLRFFDSSSTKGAYIDLTAAGSSVGTNLLGGITGAMNYAQEQSTKVTGVSSNATTIVSKSFTTNGYPVQVMVTGDAENNTAGAWVKLQLFRDSTAIGKIIHVEMSAGSENSPYALTVVDAPAAGTYTYSLKTVSTVAAGVMNFGETDGPVLTLIELSGPKGDTGAAGSAGNSFETISANGTSVIADSSTDTLTITPSNGIIITGNATSDTITISTNASDSNGASTIVARDASGNFTANTVIANLTGLASSATVAASANAVDLANVTGLSTALDGKANLSGATFTGDIAVNGGDITTTSTTATLYNTTATTVHIGNAANVTLGNIAHSGNVTVNNDLVVYGNIIFNNGASEISATTIQVDDTLISLADNNTADESDIGFYAGYTNATVGYHTGFVRDANDSGIWKLFSNVTTQPTGTVLFTNAIYDTLKLGNLTAVANVNAVNVTASNVASSYVIRATSSYLDTDILSSTTHGLQIGATAGSHLKITNSQIQSVTSGVGNALDINQYGGGVNFGLNGVVPMGLNGTLTIENTQGPTKIPLTIFANATQSAPVSIWYSGGGGGVLASISNVGTFTARNIVSTVAVGTAPFTVTSNTTVANLSANLLNGYTTASTSTANTVVLRDASNNFSANTITANLTGTASSATSAATATSATQVNTIANTTSATFYPTFVDTNNGTTAVENVYTGAGLSFNPSTNTLTTTNVAATGNVSAANFTNGGAAQLNVISTAYPMLIEAVDGITLSGNVTYKTHTAGTNNNLLASTSYVDSAGLQLRYSNAVAGTKTIDLTGAPGLIYAVLVGAGGGGGAGAAAAAGGGGGAGAIVSGWVPAVTAAIIGAAGAGGVAAVGSNGATTTYSTLIAYGGTGGGYQATLPAASSFSGGAGGGGGVSTTTQAGGATSTFVYSIGGAGGNGVGAAAAATGTAGSGATSGGGGGGAYTSSTTTGNPTGAPGGAGAVGGGGGGALASSTAFDGSATSGAGGSSYAFAGGSSSTTGTVANTAKFASGAGGAGVLAIGTSGTASTSVAQVGSAGGAGGGGGGGGAGAANGGAGGAGALLLYW